MLKALVTLCFMSLSGNLYLQMHQQHKDPHFKLKLDNFTFNFENVHAKIMDRKKNTIRAPIADFFLSCSFLEEVKRSTFQIWDCRIVGGI